MINAFEVIGHPLIIILVTPLEVAASKTILKSQFDPFLARCSYISIVF